MRVSDSTHGSIGRGRNWRRSGTSSSMRLCHWIWTTNHQPITSKLYLWLKIATGLLCNNSYIVEDSILLKTVTTYLMLMQKTHLNAVTAKYFRSTMKFSYLNDFRQSFIYRHRCFLWIMNIDEPHHEKTSLCNMRTTKAQISLRISAAGSAPLLFAA